MHYTNFVEKLPLGWVQHYISKMPGKKTIDTNEHFLKVRNITLIAL